MNKNKEPKFENESKKVIRVNSKDGNFTAFRVKDVILVQKTNDTTEYGLKYFLSYGVVHSTISNEGDRDEFYERVVEAMEELEDD